MKKYILLISLVVSYLVVFDIAINITFRYPDSSTKKRPNALQNYFEYGRSVEGKLNRMVKQNEAESATIVKYGWIKSQNYADMPQSADEPNELLIAIYGMSHTGLLGKAIHKINPNYLIRRITAPGAPPNWSYAAYENDKSNHNADVIILGILPDNIACISATSSGTFYPDTGYPYSFPRIRATGDGVALSYPPFLDLEEFRETFFDQNKWENYVNWLATNDKFYDSFIFRKSFLDDSSILRIVRRAYSVKLKRNIVNQVMDKRGFKSDCEEVKALRGMVKTFAGDVRKRGGMPILYIVNTLGNADYLYRILLPTIRENKILFLSTHEICPPDDPSVFLRENSHFIPSKDVELAAAMISIIQNNIRPNEFKTKPIAQKMLQADKSLSN